MITADEIREAFHVDPDTAAMAHEFVQSALYAADYLLGLKPNYHPYKYRNFEISLEALNILLPDCYGVEALELDEFDTLKDHHPYIDPYFGRIIGLYLNRGDTYATTILYDLGRHEFMIRSWGDWYEENVITEEPVIK